MISDGEIYYRTQFADENERLAFERRMDKVWEEAVNAMIRYQSYFYVEGDEAIKWLDILAELGARKLIELVDIAELLKPAVLPHGVPDIRLFEGNVIGMPVGPYIISYGRNRKYLGIGKVIPEKNDGK